MPCAPARLHQRRRGPPDFAHVGSARDHRQERKADFHSEHPANASERRLAGTTGAEATVCPVPGCCALDHESHRPRALQADTGRSAETVLRMKPLAKTLCAMLLAGAFGGVFFERNALSNARIENQRLRAESEETVRLVRENAEIDRLHAENQELEQ